MVVFCSPTAQSHFSRSISQHSHICIILPVPFDSVSYAHGGYENKRALIMTLEGRKGKCKISNCDKFAILLAGLHTPCLRSTNKLLFITIEHLRIKIKVFEFGKHGYYLVYGRRVRVNWHIPIDCTQ